MNTEEKVSLKKRTLVLFLSALLLSGIKSTHFISEIDLKEFIPAWEHVDS